MIAQRWMIMDLRRAQRAKFNSATTLLNQIVTTICGIVVPRLMIRAFGSEMYGATISIAQFLSYIALFEGGVGAAARAELYEPLANNDVVGVSRVFSAVKRFFSTVGWIFVGYAVLLAFTYYSFSGLTQVDYWYCVLLVLAIALSTMVDYFFGISNVTLFYADQRKYLYNLAMVASKIINTVAIVVLVTCDAELLLVKLTSSVVILMRPVFFYWYRKKHYTFVKVPRKEAVLKNKWDGLGQHFAYFLHTNTDIVLLTLFASPAVVSVYSVYSMVILSIRSITTSLVAGMEAEVGDIIAKKETETLRGVFRRYQCVLGVSGLTLFGTTAVMLMNFIRLYTAGIDDIEYMQVAFAMILLMAEALNCLSTLWQTLPISANCLGKTRWGAFGEAAVNIVVSLSLIWWNPLLGVAIGTLAAEIFKNLFYLIYGCKKILHMSATKELLRFGVSILVLVGLCAVGILTEQYVIHTFGSWALWSVLCVICCAAIAIGVYTALFPKTMKALAQKYLRRRPVEKAADRQQ